MKILRRGSFVFGAVVLLLVSLLFFTSLGYSYRDKLVPLVMLTPALVLSIYCILGEFFPVLLRRTSISVLSLDQEKLVKEENETTPAAAEKRSDRRDALITVAWLFGLSFLVFLVGFSIAVPVAVFVFLKFPARVGWLGSLVISAAAWAFVYGIFDVLLRANLFQGVVFGEIVVF